MGYDTADPAAGEFDIGLAHPVAVYWVALLRVVTGWGFVQSGLGKLLQNGLDYAFGPVYLRGIGDTVLGPLATWMGYNIPGLVEAMVPLGELLIASD